MNGPRTQAPFGRRSAEVTANEAVGAYRLVSVLASGGPREQKKYGQLLISRNVPVGQITVEAQVRGSNFLPLPADMKPLEELGRLKPPPLVVLELWHKNFSTRPLP